MTDAQIGLVLIAAGIILLVLIFVGIAWLIGATAAEAERKLAREVTDGEVFLFVLLACALPLGPAIVLVYVWWVLPEPKESGG